MLESREKGRDQLAIRMRARKVSSGHDLIMRALPPSIVSDPTAAGCLKPLFAPREPAPAPPPSPAFISSPARRYTRIVAATTMLPARRVPGTPLDVPEHPHTHALASTTFSPPPLDGSLTVPEFYDWHHGHSAHHPVFIYSDNGSLCTIYWRDAARAVHRAARIVLGHARDKLSGDSKPLVFAILASNGERVDFNFGRVCLTNYLNCPESITYFTLMAGICRSGMTAFPISPRNSPAAIAHLLAKTEASHIFVGPESALQNLAASAFGHLDASGTTLPASCHVPTFAELYPNTAEDNFELLPPLNVSWDDPTIIVHSSGETHSFPFCTGVHHLHTGSTAFPKPIVWTHERYFLLARHPCTGVPLLPASANMF